MHPKLRLLLHWLNDGIVSMPPTSRADGGVLVVRLDAIGDFVLWLREAQSLREALPGQRITLAANAVWAPLARQLPYWDEVIAIDVGNYQHTFLYRWHCLRRIRRGNFATAVQPTYSRTLDADSLVRASRARDRIGNVGDLTNISPRQRRLSDPWYTRLVPIRDDERTEIERNRTFLRGLTGGMSPERGFRLPHVAQLPAHMAPSRPFFIVFPGASWAGRQWPVASFAQVVDALEQQHGWDAVLCGSGAERALCSEVAALCARLPLNLAGLTSLPEFCELLRQARLLVANETSAVHIAAAVDTPSVCLLGGGHFGRFVPYPVGACSTPPEPVHEPMPCYGCNWTCTQPHVPGDAVPCVSAISVVAVLRGAERALASHTRDATPASPVRIEGGRRTRGESGPPPRISVLTVVRNGEATLAQTLASVLDQPNDGIEYIVIDGASTDGTVDILRAHDDRLAYWSSEPDRGIYDAMNKALTAARGDWVVFLGADDQMKPVLQSVAGQLRDPRAVYYGNVELSSSGAVYAGRFSRYRLMQQNICHQALLYPRSVYKHKTYDTDCGLLADHRYNIELMGSGRPFVYIDKTISRFNDNGLSARPDPGFEAVKLAAIRRSFGWPLYAVKRVRNGCVRMLKGRHVTA